MTAMTKLAWILVGGRLVQTEALQALPRPDLVIAADGGARHAALLGAAIDAWVGDFDSSDDLNLTVLNLTVPRTVYPRAKASTDAELATQLARDQGATELIILGAFGGRFDHSFALALGAVRLAQEGIGVTLHSGDESGHPLLPGQPLRLFSRPGQTFSVLAASELTGLSIEGARWNLDRATVPLGGGLTISNEAAGPVLTFDLQAGTALVTLLDGDPT
jgi:thiamine pyrophosphokinase